MRYEMTYGCSGDKESVRVASDASNTVFTALRDAASAAYWVSYRLHAPADSTYIAPTTATASRRSTGNTRPCSRRRSSAWTCPCA